MNAVFKKEFKSSMNGMTGPIFMFAVLIIMGFFVRYYQFEYSNTHFEYSVADGSFWALILTPILTMRSFTEERKTKTDQLLYSLPITTTQIVLGKFFALAAVLAIPCVVMCAYPVIAYAYASNGINFAVCYGVILAFFLLGCAVIALSMFVSSLFESQVICVIVNIALLLATYFVSSQASKLPENAAFTLALLIILSLVVTYIVYTSTKNYIAAAICGVLLVGGAITVYFIDSSLYTGLGVDMIGSLFIFTPLVSFTTGVFDITCLVYYLSVAALFIFVTVQSFERRRWN